MSVFTKIVTGVFGKKSDRDMKMLTPYIDKINTIYDELVNLTDDELKNRFNKIKDDVKEQMLIANKQLMGEGLKSDELKTALHDIELNLINDNMVEVFAIV